MLPSVTRQVSLDLDIIERDQDQKSLRTVLSDVDVARNRVGASELVIDVDIERIHADERAIEEHRSDIEP